MIGSRSWGLTGRDRRVKLASRYRVAIAHRHVHPFDTKDRLAFSVNDAGVVGALNWWERETPSDEDWDRVLAVNLRGTVIVSEAVAPHMKERRYGKIINIASIAARQGGRYIAQYMHPRLPL